jgi:LysM repeat protein
LAGVGVGIAVSPLRGQAASASRPTAAATAADASGQPPASQPAAATNPPAAAQPTAAQSAPAAQPTAAAAAPVPTTPPQPTPTTRPGQKEYVIQSGDTLFAIAQRNNTTVDALVAANNLRSRDVTLNVGQKLIIPAP